MNYLSGKPGEAHLEKITAKCRECKERSSMLRSILDPQFPFERFPPDILFYRLTLPAAGMLNLERIDPVVIELTRKSSTQGRCSMDIGLGRACPIRKLGSRDAYRVGTTEAKHPIQNMHGYIYFAGLIFIGF